MILRDVVTADWLTLFSRMVGTIFKKLPNLKIAVPMDKIEYTPLTRDVGIVKLPVTW